MGQVFTPEHIVNKILDEVGYKGENILNKKILEPSFGEGVFLFEIIKRLIDYCESLSMSKEEIKEQLEKNVYGVEIDKDLYNYTLDKLNLLTNTNDIKDVNWKLYNKDTLTYTNYDFFDFVVGNPPYIRIHNLSKEVRDNLKDYDFTEGMTDMYIIFFGLGIKFLNNKGKLGYITPNSYMKNTSQSKFRKYLIKENLIEKIIDYGSSKLFNNADTYTAITILSKNKIDYNLTYSRINDSEVFRKPIAFSCGLETQANGQLLSNCQTNELQSLVGDTEASAKVTYNDTEASAKVMCNDIERSEITNKDIEA